MTVGSNIWVCHRKPVLDEDEPIEYTAPQQIKTRLNYLTVQPASGYVRTMEFGENVSKTWTVVANKRLFDGKFNEGDLFYVDGVQPITGSNYMNGQGANAVVTSVRPQNLAIYIILQKLDLR